tara:strand:+ start:208 stop:483 length:276 start_codon:yes stop_codon:yes gene_type:complete
MSELFADSITALGLVLTALGAFIAAKAVIIDVQEAIYIGTPRFADEDEARNESLPAVQNLLAASKGARRGLLFVGAGTGLQLIPVVYRLIT